MDSRVKVSRKRWAARRPLAWTVVVGLMLSALGALGTSAAHAAPGDYSVTLEAPASVPVGESFNYRVKIPGEATPQAPIAGVELTVQLAAGVAFDDVPLGAASPVESFSYDPALNAVTFVLEPLIEQMSQFDFSVTQANNREKDSSTVFGATLTGTPNNDGSVPAAEASTSVTGELSYLPMKSQEAVVGSGNRTVTFFFNVKSEPETTAVTGEFTSWGLRLTDTLPAGARVVATSPGFGEWAVTGDEATGQTVVWTRENTAYGPSGLLVDPSTRKISVTVRYPKEVFPTGTTPPDNTVRLEARDFSGNWEDQSSTTVKLNELADGESKFLAISKDANGRGDARAGHTDGYWIPFYQVKAAYLNDEDSDLLTKMVVEDSARQSEENAAFFGHAELYHTDIRVSAVLEAAAVPYEVEYLSSLDDAWHKVPGASFSTSEPARVVYQTAGSSGYAEEEIGGQHAVVSLRATEKPIGWRVTAGTPAVPVPPGSEFVIDSEFVPLHVSQRDGTTSSEYLPNTATVSGETDSGAELPGDTATSHLQFNDAIVVVTQVVAPATLTVGESASYEMGISNLNTQRDYTDAIARVVLPEGVFYDAQVGVTPATETVSVTGYPVPKLGEGVTVTTSTVVDAEGRSRQVVEFAFDNLPSMRPLGEPSDREAATRGLRYTIPVNVLPQAFDPADPVAPVASYATVLDSNLTDVPFNWYQAQFGEDEFGFDPHRDRIARALNDSQVITGGGLFIGKLTRADAQDDWGLLSQVAAGATAEWQLYASNLLPEAVTDFVLFDRLPEAGDGRGSEVTTRLAAPVEGVPAGGVIEYSTDATSASTGTWTSEAVGAAAFRVSLPQLASSDAFELTLVTSLSDSARGGDLGINEATATGMYAGSQRNFYSNQAEVMTEGIASIALEKRTNGEVYAAAPGAIVDPGDDVTWSYLVTNTGDVPLDDVELSDAFEDGQGESGQFEPVSEDSGELAPGDTREFQATAPAVVGQYHNVATVSARPATEGVGEAADEVTASAESWYRAGNAAITVIKHTNGERVTSAPGPTLEVGSQVTWDYTVRNTGTVDLADVLVVDTLPNGDEVFRAVIPQLAAGAEVTLSESGAAVLGDYTNTVTVTAANPLGGDQLSASDVSFYHGKKTPGDGGDPGEEVDPPGDGGTPPVVKDPKPGGWLSETGFTPMSLTTGILALGLLALGLTMVVRSARRQES
ncbi:DUF7507 domain-containing protein [Leucobacter komagatae]|uniref:DUF7507 domain-containing protein n=1 Tax=Leucobacter komagatae TaxID=55969 RepID=A0A0D0IPR2_9MICO|nr:DUF11 domain-containing protein [Leucobacter komagatae]KIP53584.1 hypothetical protein SD72_02695 [Leucobacter komagatae]